MRLCQVQEVVFVNRFGQRVREDVLHLRVGIVQDEGDLVARAHKVGRSFLVCAWPSPLFARGYRGRNSRRALADQRCATPARRAHARRRRFGAIRERRRARADSARRAGQTSWLRTA